jgi:hypothetical protein
LPCDGGTLLTIVAGGGDDDDDGGLALAGADASADGSTL